MSTIIANAPWYVKLAAEVGFWLTLPVSGGLLAWYAYKNADNADDIECGSNDITFLVD